MTLRASEDKLWSVLVHPHEAQDTKHNRGVENNIPRWKIPKKARNEHSEAMIQNHHFLKGGFAEFYGGNNNNNNEASSPDRNHASQKLAPIHEGGDRKHFPHQRCQEKEWHPSFKRATIEIFPSRPTGKRALTPPHQYDRTEVEDVPRGKKKLEPTKAPPSSLLKKKRGLAGDMGGDLDELPMFQSVLRAVRDAKTGQRIQDKRCEESAEEVALRRGIKKIGFVSQSDREFEERKMKTDSTRVQNEIEFRREYNARMAASTVLNRDASSRQNRESTIAQENLNKHRTSVRRQVADRSRAYDVEIVRNLPSFAGRDDD
jgi:hypothetical protein